MPSPLHETLVEMFRSRPQLACELVERMTGIELVGRSELASADMTQAVSVEYRADAVTVVRDDRGETATAVVVEVQLRSDPDKRYTWPVYATSLRARLRAPVRLLVLCPDDAVARWAREPIDLGHPGFVLAPIVVGYRDVPRIPDPAVARRMPELAVLSTLAHRELSVAIAATEAIATLPEDAARVYFDMILKALPLAARTLLEARVFKNYEYESDFARRFIREGREEGRLDGLHEAVRALVGVKLGVVADDDAERIASLDASAATELLIALGRATEASQVRAELDRIRLSH